MSQYDYRALYTAGLRNIESGTEGRDKFDLATPVIELSGSTGPSSLAGPSSGRELTGRSRVILKHYFEKSPPFRFPLGHSTIAFTEPQLHHLLRVLTDETVSHSFSTIERMVLDAVRGKSTTAPS